MQLSALKRVCLCWLCAVRLKRSVESIKKCNVREQWALEQVNELLLLQEVIEAICEAGNKADLGRIARRDWNECGIEADARKWAAFENISLHRPLWYGCFSPTGKVRNSLRMSYFCDSKPYPFERKIRVGRLSSLLTPFIIWIALSAGVTGTAPSVRVLAATTRTLPSPASLSLEGLLIIFGLSLRMRGKEGNRICLIFEVIHIEPISDTAWNSSGCPWDQ